MTNLDILTVFFGWCAIINIGVLLFTTVSLILMKGFVAGIHSRLFGIDQQNLPEAYFSYLANYKLAILLFNIVPYFALKLV